MFTRPNWTFTKRASNPSQPAAVSGETASDSGGTAQTVDGRSTSGQREQTEATAPAPRASERTRLFSPEPGVLDAAMVGKRKDGDGDEETEDAAPTLPDQSALPPQQAPSATTAPAPEQPVASTSTAPPPAPASAVNVIPGGYTATRHATNPLGPHTIEILNGRDATSKRWPSGTQLVKTPREGDGKLIWYVEYPHDSGKHVKWRQLIGAYLAEKLNLTRNPNEKWVLKDFPPNYKFFEHHMGDRTDPYLFGTKHKNESSRFRSVPEVKDHMLWLARNDDSARCVCKYCAQAGGWAWEGATAKKRDTIIAKPTNAKAIRAPTSSAPKVKTKRPRGSAATADENDSDAPNAKRQATSARTAAITARAPKRVAKPKPRAPGPYIDPMRAKELNHRDFGRHKELVWVSVEPLKSNRAGIPSIEWWPGVIVGHQTVIANRRIEKDGRFASDEVRQYSVRLLGIADVDDVTRMASELLPWLARTDDTALWDLSVTAEPAFSVAWDLQKKRLRNPFPRWADLKQRVDCAITAYANATQIATEISHCFTLIDRYDRRRPELRSAPRLASNPHDHEHYQCLAWGPEMLWEGDVLRLLTYERNLQPGKAPATASTDDDLGPGGKYFMHTSAFFRHLETDCAMIAGTVYELVKLQPGETVDQSPRRSYEDMALPPRGFRWHCLTEPGFEQTLDVEHIAGRYYDPRYLHAPNDAAVEIRERLCRLGGLERTEVDGKAQLNPGSAHDLYPRVMNWSGSRKRIFVEAEMRANISISKHVYESRANDVSAELLAEIRSKPKK